MIDKPCRFCHGRDHAAGSVTAASCSAGYAVRVQQGKMSDVTKLCVCGLVLGDLVL